MTAGLDLIAHRGGAGDAPENTLAAFSRVLGDGLANWVELDVQRSSDGQLLVFHDDTPERTSNAVRRWPGRAALPFGSFDAAALRSLDAGSWFDASRHAGERIPTLDEVLELLGGRLGILLELKSPRLYPGMEQQVADALARHGLDRRPGLQVWSFEFDALERFHQIMPHVPLGAFVRDIGLLRGSRFASILQLVGVYPDVSEQDLQIARQQGWHMVASTLNSAARIRKARDMGITRIISDYPALLDSAVRDAGPLSAVCIAAVQELPGLPACREVLLRNEGSEALDLHGWYLRHGWTTPLAPAATLQPGQTLAQRIELTVRDRGRHALRPLALHDAHHTLADCTEF